MRRFLFLMLVIIVASQISAADAPLKVTVEAEEEVYRYEPPNNGSGPFWCFGCTCIVRSGDTVLASGMETIPDAKPLNNTRWALYQRTPQGWRLCQKDASGRTREPSPLGVLADGSALLSVNPTLTKTDVYSGPAQPQILRFNLQALDQPFKTILPTWEGQPAFTEHSYRSFTVDGARSEILLLQNIGYTHACWSLLDRTGKGLASGRLTWPMGTDYAKPQPIRLCYPSVQLKDRAVYFCGVSDIVEPNESWREYKQQLTGQKWDYDFRRLFFTWIPDLAKGTFKPWIEIASREKTCGWIFPCDLWVDGQGVVHLLWTERAIDTRLRTKFFPSEKQSEALNYARVKDGQVVLRRSILRVDEGDANAPVPGRSRFQVLPDGRLLVFLHARIRDGAGKRVEANQLVEIKVDGTLGASVTVPLKVPMGTFFTASVRAGCAPSGTLDLLGESGRTIRYAQLKLQE